MSQIIDNLRFTTNVEVLYTATASARIHRYEIVIPVDGVNARTRYAHEYSSYQLSVLPGGVNKRIRFTTLGTTSLNLPAAMGSGNFARMDIFVKFR